MFRFSRIPTGEELRVEADFDLSDFFEIVDPSDLQIVDTSQVFIQVTVNCALHELIDIAGSADPKLVRAAYQRRVGGHLVADGVLGGRADEPVQRFFVGSRGRLGEPITQCRFQQ